MAPFFQKVELKGPWYRTDTVSGIKTKTLLGTYVSNRGSTDKSGSATPGYWGKVKRKEILPINGYTAKFERCVMPHGSYLLTWVPNGNTSFYEGIYSGGFGNRAYLMPVTSRYSNAWAAINNSILGKMKIETVNLGNALAERHQLFSMITENARKIAASISSLKKGNITRALQHLAGSNQDVSLRVSRRLKRQYQKQYKVDKMRATANAWLQLQYGWLPLLSDLYGAQEALADELYKARPPVYTASSYKELHEDRTDSPVNDFITHYHTTVRLSASVRYTVDNAGYKSLANFGLTNPLEIAWEMLPWSFVVDWFLPVGKAIKNLDATIGCVFVDGFTNNKSFSTIEMLPFGDCVIGNYRYSGATIKGFTQYTQFNRGSVTGFPSACFPRFKDPVSLGHFENALALLTQAIRP